ncbi:signal peptidase I, partial [Dysosmobacter welbionis]
GQLLQEFQLLLTDLPAGGNELGQIPLALVQPLLGGLHLLAQLADLLPGAGLRLGQDLVPLGLCLVDDGVRHLLGGQQGGAHGVLGGTVVLHLFHQDLQLGLQRRVLLVERGVIIGELVQKLIDHGHVISAHHCLGKGVGGNFLWCQHSAMLPPRVRSEIEAVVLQLVDQIALDIHMIGRDDVCIGSHLLDLALAGIGH